MREGTLCEGGQCQEEAGEGKAALPAHEARVLQGVAVLPAHAHNPSHQLALLYLHIFNHLCSTPGVVRAMGHVIVVPLQ